MAASTALFLSAAIAQLLEVWEKEDRDFDLLYTFDTHHKESYLSSQEGRFLPVEHCIENTWGWEIVSELSPNLYKDHVKTMIKKPTFGSRELLDFLLREQASYQRIIVSGLVTDICVVSAALMAKTAAPEKPVYVVSDLTDSYDKEGYKAALKVMEQCQCQIVLSKDL